RARLPRRERIPRRRRAHHGRRVQTAAGRHARADFRNRQARFGFSTVGGWRLYPLQSVVGGGRRAADRERTRHSGGDGAHADYWEAFRSLGITDRIAGHGRLMLSLSEMAPAVTAAAARG